MQIFSPSDNFVEIAKSLDNKRLNKQKVELYQIINCIIKGDMARGWKNHPAVKMAKNHELFFIDYGLKIAYECLERNFKDTLIPKLELFKTKFKSYNQPDFWGDEKFHSSHRAALLFKNYDHYKQFGWKEKPELNYVWPK